MEKVKPEIFRAYDVRGHYPTEVNAHILRLLANATAKFLRGSKEIVLGRDGRLSSPELAEAVKNGLLDAGVDVLDIGQATTPLFYFSIKKLKADGGIMVTASHNPADHNGIKINKKDGMPVGMGGGLKEIKMLSLEGYYEAPKRGTVKMVNDMSDKYAEFLMDTAKIKLDLIQKKVVMDAGNGTASITLKPLLKKCGINCVPLFFEIDGNFPNRSPDPLDPGSLDALSKKVVEEKADLGLAFDADADRLAVVDEKGKIVLPQYVLAILWKNERSLLGIPKVVYDLRFSRAIQDFFGKYGIRSIVGRTRVSDMMRYIRASIGGEMTGHFFFREMGYTESSELASLKLLKAMAKSEKPLSEMVEPYRKYFYSGEINLTVKDPKHVDSIFDGLKKHYRDGKWDRFDGLTVGYSDWWFNVRASNTESLLRLVVEAEDEGLMNKKVEELKKLIPSFS